MNTLLNFEITTPERTVLKQAVRQVTIPTSEGEITILPGHLPLVAPVDAGEIRAVGEDGNEVLMSVAGGFVTIQADDKVVVLADTAERAEELDLKAIEEAHRKAEALMQEKITDEERFADAAAGLARELARLKVVRKHHGRRGLTPPEAR